MQFDWPIGFSFSSLQAIILVFSLISKKQLKKAKQIIFQT